MERYRRLLMGGLFMLAACGQDKLAQCRSVYAAADWPATVTICRETYAESKDANSGLWLSRAQLQLGQYDDALRTASSLFGSAVDITAKQVAATAYLQLGEREKARPLLVEAFTLHRAAGKHDEAARDAHMLAGSYLSEQLFMEALQALDDCLVEAEASRDAVMMGYAHLAIAETMSSLGDKDAAERAFQQAELDLRDSPNNQAWLTFKFGLFRQEFGQYAQAEGLLREALSLAIESNRADVILGAKLNLVYSLMRLERTQEAEAMLKEIEANPEEYKQVSEAGTIFYLQGVLARGRGEFAESARLLARAAQFPPHRDWILWIAQQQGRTAAALGDNAQAEAFYRSAIQTTEKIRDDTGDEDLRAWVISERRGSYEGLFTLLAKQGRSEEALAVLESMHARSFLDCFLLRESLPLTSEASAVRAASMKGFFSLLRRSPAASPLPVGPLLLSLASLDILAYEEADGRLWAARVNKQKVTLTDLGVAEDIYRAAKAFANKPSDARLAEKAGDVLLPVWTSSDEPLYLVLNDELARIPFAALQRRQRFFIQERPLVIAPSLSALAPSAVVFSGAPLVVGSPSDDLPAARAEAEQVARSLGVAPLLGAAATEEKIAAASGARLLHLATHARVSAAGGALQLAGQELTASEVVSLGLNASVVVLASCASAVSFSSEQWGSLAMAFLATGSRSVVATLRSVNDEDARRLVTLFYQRDWTQPANALAQAQRQLVADKAPVESWAFFAVYGAAPSVPSVQATPLP